MKDSAGPGDRQAGVALIIVLWTVVFLMFVVGHIEATGRSQAALALNLRRGAALEAQADGAIAVGAFHLLDQSAGHWAADGQVHVVRVAGGGFTRRVAIRLMDQSGRINLNQASVPLLTALLETVGTNPVRAAAIARAIDQWRSANGNAAAAIALASQYRATGHDYGPPGAPFERVAELGLVEGMTPRLLAKLRPHLTVYYPNQIDLAFADPVVKQALQRAGFGTAVFMAHPPGLRVVRITATATGPAGTHFTRRAIVRLGNQAGGWMRVLTWSHPDPASGHAPRV